jgi:hypothetical protein
LLADAYRAYRERAHLLSLSGDARLAPVAEFKDERDGTTKLWSTHLADINP